MNASHLPPLKPKIILGIAAHPDDLDFGAGGTIAKFCAEGAKMYYLLLTDGSKGSADPNMTSPQLVQIRHEEQKAACKALGATDVFFIDQPDGMLEVTMDLKKEVVKYIRQLKPDTVITMDPSVLYFADWGMVNHPDHRAAGQIALDAVFPLARDRLTFPELLADGYEPHKVGTVLLINFKERNCFVDISMYMDKKIEGLAAHASQIGDIKAIEDRFKEIGSQLGATSGYQYAESFVRLEVPA